MSKITKGDQFRGKSGTVYTVEWVRNHVVCLVSKYTLNPKKYKPPASICISEDVLHGENWERITA